MSRAWVAGSLGQDTYERYVVPFVVRGPMTVQIASDTAFVNAVAKVIGPNGELARKPVTMASHSGAIWYSTVATFDSTLFPEGNLVQDGEIDNNAPMLHWPVIVDNDHAPLLGQQMIPVGVRNQIGEFGEDYDRTGYAWVQYPPANPVLGAKKQIRLATPHSTRKTLDQYWQEPMGDTSGGSDFAPRQFVKVIDGQPTIAELQPYTQELDFNLSLGENVDGPAGVGRSVSEIDGYVDQNGALVYLTSNGAVRRKNLDGSDETLLGWRVKPGLLPAIYTDTAAMIASNEHVGVITDGPATLNQPFAICVDPRDWNIFYIADSGDANAALPAGKSNRIVRYDIAAKSGYTWLGALNGEQGLVDGNGTNVRFNKPRGICWEKNATPADDLMFIADDHNSAVRQANRSRDCTTLVQSARGNNFDLTLPQLGQSMINYTNWLRPQLNDGAFGVANFMHPQQIKLDQNGDLVTPCHHPHTVIRIGRKGAIANTVKTIANLDVSLMLPEKVALAWISFSCDALGVCGQAGDMIFGYWAQQSARRHKYDGSFAGFFDGIDGSGGYLDHGPVSSCREADYAAMCVFGWDGSLWHSSRAGSGIMRQTLKVASDPAINAALFQAGVAWWKGGSPPRFVLHGGMRGSDALGGVPFYAMAGKTDAEIQAYVQSIDPAIPAATIPAAVYYVKWEAMMYETGPALPPPADVTAPDTMILTGPPNSQATTGTITFSGSDDRAGPLSFVGSLDGAAFAPVTSPVNLTGLSVGAHAYRVATVDAALNVDPTPGTSSWTVLAPPPDPCAQCAVDLTAARAKLTQIVALAGS